MTSPAPIPTERLEEIIAAYRPAECDADSCEDPFCPYPHFASCGDFSLREYGLARELLSLRQQAQPTREEGWRVKELEWDVLGENGFIWAADAYYIGYQSGARNYWVHHRVFGDLRSFDGSIATYGTPDEAKAAAQADYASRISSALLPIDAPAPEGGGEWEALQAVVSAWEATKAGDTTVPEIQRWLIEDMKPAIDAARRILASPAEPAAHSLQTLAPASDAVKPGDETK
jgi:hypothetical protein